MERIWGVGPGGQRSEAPGAQRESETRKKTKTRNKEGSSSYSLPMAVSDDTDVGSDVTCDGVGGDAGGGDARRDGVV